MLHIVLHQPEIPPNTGNIIRLCANSGHSLHLIKPMGFDLDDKKVKRAGLDYHELTNVSVYDTLENFITQVQPAHLYALSTKGKTCYTSHNYTSGDAFLFGSETRGLPDSILHSLPEQRVLRIPMKKNSRSMNLSNAVSIVLYEAWRQSNFYGAEI